MKKVTVCKHPFIAWQLTELRDVKTIPRRFHELVLIIARFLIYEACRNFQSQVTMVSTPTGETTTGHNIPAEEIIVVPVMRAGIHMADAAIECIPGVQIRHLGLERNEHPPFKARVYYEKRPKNTQGVRCVVMDPMIATGGSSCDALSHVKGWGISNVSLVGIIAAPQGIAKVQEQHPDVSITVAVIDRDLNDKAYIIPGLGDAGDRQFNT